MNISNALGVILLLLAGASVLYSLILAFLALTPPQRRFLLRLLFPRQKEKMGMGRIRTGRIRIFMTLLRFPRKIITPFLPPEQSGKVEEVARACSRKGFYATTFFALLALGVLTWNLVGANFSNRYVVAHISPDLPYLYRFSALWAGPAGSFLFWYCILALFSVLILRRAERLRFERRASLHLLLGVILFFFILLLLLHSDVQPFRVFALPRATGIGLNPLLQHWAMILHPPLLLAGYAGSAIAFALAFMELPCGLRGQNIWPEIRRQVLFAWYLLGGGILLGAIWSYDELGWGGYWAWDPVENAGLLPFLTLSTYLHSRPAQEKRGQFRILNIFLLGLSFLLCIFSAWITRSGFLTGLHTFAGSSIGPFFLLFLFLFSLLVLRTVQLSRRTQPASLSYRLFSREGVTLLYNYLTFLILLILLLGIFSPRLPIDCTFDGANFSCHKTEWKPAAFNRALTAPGMIALLLTGLGPLLFWRRNNLERFVRRLRGPLFTGMAGGIVFVLFVRTGLHQPLTPSPDSTSAFRALLITFLVFFIAGGAVQEIGRALRAHLSRHPADRVTAIFRLFRRERRRLGGALIHVSLALLFLSFAGGTFEVTRRIEFHLFRTPADPSSTKIEYRTLDRAYFAGYEIEVEALDIAPRSGDLSDPFRPEHLTVAHEARFTIRDPGGSPESIRTANVFYPQVDPLYGMARRDRQKRILRRKIGEPGILKTWTADIRIQLHTLRRPGRPEIPELNHPFEFYYLRPGNRRLAHDTLFPPALIAAIEIKRNPLARFFRLGTLFFCILGFVQLLPGEKRESPFRFQVPGH